MPRARWVVIGCAAAVAAALWPWFGTPHVTVIAGNGNVLVRGARLPVRVTVDIAPAAPAVRRILEYDDPRYARGRGMSDRFASGFPEHLRIALAYRGVVATVLRVDADSLARALSEDPTGVCVIVPGGILPDTVRRGRHDELRGFIERGGIALSAGAPFDAYYSVRDPGGARGGAPPPDLVVGPDTSSWPELYGPGGPLVATDPRLPRLRFASMPSATRAASGLTFDAATFAVNASALERIGGTPISSIDADGRSSVSVLPAGRGRVVIFGDAFDDELQAAAQISQIIATGVWFDPRNVRVVAQLDTAHPAASIPVPPGMRVFAFGEPPYYFPFGY